MTLNDPLANALSLILHAEQLGRVTCKVPNSKVIKQVLDAFKEQGYIGGYEESTEERGVLVVTLSGMINKSGVIKPRYNVDVQGFERFEKRYLPAKNMGIIVLSTSQGIMNHRQAKEKHTGGKLLAYCY